MTNKSCGNCINELTSKKNNSVPAFPSFKLKHVEIRNGNTFPVQEPVKGMSLRDYFAAKAMQSLIAKMPLDITVSKEDEHIHDVKFDSVTRGAYRYADAMIKAREE